MKILIYSLAVLLIIGCTNNNASDQSGANTNNYNATNNPTESDGRTSPEELNQETNVDDDALTFIKLAAASNTMEIEIGKLAQQNAANTRVKNFGSMMVTDHSAANNELKKLAADKNVVVNYALKPDQKKHIEDLKKLKGAEFDKHYMQMMVGGHSKDIAVFENGADNRDKAINRFANKTLPILKKHLDSARAINASVN